MTSSVDLYNVSVEMPVYYRTGRSIPRTLVTRLGGRITRKQQHADKVVALDDVSLHFRRGDRVALIGSNGAGKTTLLRVMAGIFEPVRGSVEVRGRIAPLIDISAGIEQEATGYENIRLRSAYFGLLPGELAERMADIEDFCELGEFLDMPVKTYSAGMSLRLALAISTFFDPEVLLMDEWITAGDLRFLDRAHRRMERFIEQSSLMVLASHAPDVVRAWCNKAVLVERGRIVAEGGVDDILEMAADRQPFLSGAADDAP